jgi:hypothetical protein
MKLYLLRIDPDESASEGERWDEWFSSLEAARRRRSEMIRKALAGEKDMRCGADFQIEMCEIADLPKRALVLAALNGKGYVDARTTVVPEWVGKQAYEERP